MAGTSCSCKLGITMQRGAKYCRPTAENASHGTLPFVFVRPRARGNPKARAKCSNLLRTPTADFPTSVATKATPPCLSRL